jgi:hypothetical protein
VVVAKWNLLGDLVVVYCDAASWELAAGHWEEAFELVEKACACLRQRKRESHGKVAFVGGD